MTILVYGATGTQGGPVARALLQRGTPVRAIARSEATAAALTAMGAEVVDADLGDSASLEAATKGVDAVFVQLPASVPAQTLTEYARAALSAIAAAGSPHTVITTSSVVPAARTGVPYADAKLSIVELAGELTPHAVLLHPAIYLDNLSGPLRPAIEQGVLPYPIPADVPVSWLSAQDAAAFATAALGRPDLAGRRFALGGGAPLTGPDLAARLTAVLRRPVRYQAIGAEEFGAQLAPYLGELAAGQIAAFYAWKGTAGAALLAPDLAGTTAALGTVPTALDEWIEGALA